MCKNKGANQLCGISCNLTAHQHLCFCYIDCTIALLSKSKISSLQPSSVAVQPGLSRTWLETLKTSHDQAHLSRIMRKPAIFICKNNDADQLRGNREADQHLCFSCTDCTIPLLPKSEISSHQPFSVVVQPGLCGTWSATPKPVYSRRGSYMLETALRYNISTLAKEINTES